MRLSKVNVYRLEIPKAVQRQINTLPGNYRQWIRRLIEGLTTNPRPRNAEPLRGAHGRYRITLDTYRVEDDILLIEVLKVGAKHGPEFYEDIG
jgi:mRNA interferase RelE/StbE